MPPPEISQVVSAARAAAEADEQYDPSKDPKRRPTRSKDPGWKYAFWPDLENKFSLQCTLCGKKVPSGVTRFKKHLAGGFAIVEKCPKTTAEIRKEMHEYLRTHGQKFESIDLDGHGDGEGSDDEAQAATSSKASNNTGKRKTAATPTSKTSLVVASQAKRQTKSIADDIRKTPEEIVAERHRLKGVQRTMKDYSKEKKDIVDDHVADFLYENCLPLNIVQSRSWEILLESIGQYGSDYVSPSYHDVRIPLLEKAKLKTDTLREKHEKAWKEYGCSLMSDGWTDMSGRHLINFLVNSPEVLWWGAYGGLAYELQCLAKRIISLCASSSGCERNWSVFAHIHTKGRNRLEYKRLNKLSYVSYNRQMTNRFEKLREEGSKGKRAQALILEEFQWDNEWVDINAELVHQAEAQGADVDGTNSLRWTHVDEAMGATEGLQGRNFPRRARGDDSESSRPTRPYITYGRRVPNLALIDPVLRAELEEEVPDSDMENSDADGDSTRRIERDEDYDLEME